MSLFNLKHRIDDLGMTQVKILEIIKQKYPKYLGVRPGMFSDMIKGKYDYGMGPEVVSLANEIVSEMEASK